MALLADLQDEQDREIATTLRGIENMVSISTIKYQKIEMPDKNDVII